MFVPKDCADGAACRVHIALHGCDQDVGHIGQHFVNDTGYNAWADTNHLIVLYPQTKASSFAPANPQACWDWWSYISHSDDYVTKAGAQIKVIKAMLDALTSGVQAPAATSSVSPAAATPAKPGVSVIDTSDSGADLALDPLPGGATYRISRAGADGPLPFANHGPELRQLWLDAANDLSLACCSHHATASKAPTRPTSRPPPGPCRLLAIHRASVR